MLIASSSVQRNGWLVMAGVVGLAVLAGHIWSIDTGLYLDDHAHFEHLHNDDWSFHSAVEASRLGIVGDVMDLWGRHESALRFFRPIAFWIMKIEYTIGRWNPAVMHLFSISWHFICCMLTGALAMRCLGKWFWATVAACLLAIHPGHLATVYWVACQTELMATAFLLIATLAYAQHAGWPQPIFLARNNPLPLATSNPAAITPAAIVAVVCYGLALGCRENAVLFPAVCFAGDWLCGTTRRRRIRPEHLAMGCALVAYLALRWYMLGGFPLPAKPYLMPVTDPEFPKFALDKISIYIMALFIYVPVVPIGGRTYLVSRPLWLYGGLIVGVLIVVLIWLAYRRSKALLWPIVWMACFFAAVIPVFASSHHLYLPGVAAAILVSAGLAAIAGLNPQPTQQLTQRPPLFRKYICTTLIVMLLVLLGSLTWCMSFAFTRGTLIEDVLVDEVCDRGPEIKNGDHLFFVNIPVVAHYATMAIKARLGLDELHGHVVTFSPDLMRMESPGQIQVLDAHRLRIRSAPENRYLEGATGHMLLGAMGLHGLTGKDRPLNAGLFTVTPTEIDEKGIHELLFDFRDRLDSPAYHFYYGSPQFTAYPLDMSHLIQTASQTAPAN